jgi:ADP-heptose:LPS heptosyltransferase
MKVLLIKRGAIGDILMTTPLIRQLNKNFSGIEIDFLTTNSMASCLVTNKYIHNIIKLVDTTFSIKGVFKYVKYLVSIRYKYDYVIILGKNTLMNIITKLFIGSNVIGFARDSLSRLILDQYVIYNNVERYQVDYYLDLLATFNNSIVDYNDNQMELSYNDKDISHVDSILKEQQINKYVVVTNSGGNNQFETSGIRMLNNDNIIQLLIKLLLKYPKVILLGGKIDIINYNFYINSIPAHLRTNIINMAGIFNLHQSVYFLSKAQRFYTTDCGAMHLGLIAGIDYRMTCFFGATNPWHILPKNTKVTVVWQDDDIYDPRYQLYGKLNNNQYFQKLNINEID